MKKIPSESIDLILTDPPYLAKYKSRDGRSIKNDIDSDWLKTSFKAMYRVLKKDSFCISFYGWHQVEKFMIAWKSAGFYPVGHLVFPKSYSSKKEFVGYNHECAYLLAKGRPDKPENPIGDVVEGWKYTGNFLHPTQKPVGIISNLIESFSKKGDMILDPFCGSGTTGIACKRLNRKFVGIEIDETYYELAGQRLK